MTTEYGTLLNILQSKGVNVEDLGKVEEEYPLLKRPGDELKTLCPVVVDLSLKSFAETLLASRKETLEMIDKIENDVFYAREKFSSAFGLLKTELKSYKNKFTYGLDFYR